MLLKQLVWNLLLGMVQVFRVALALALGVFAHADEHDSCPGWAASGECEANPGYMLASCRQSCAQYAAPVRVIISPVPTPGAVESCIGAPAPTPDTATRIGAPFTLGSLAVGCWRFTCFDVALSPSRRPVGRSPTRSSTSQRPPLMAPSCRSSKNSGAASPS